MTDAYIRTVALMGTVVTIEVVGHGSKSGERIEREKAVSRAVAWFERIQRSCSRFDPNSEISELSARIGSPVAVSATTYEAVKFALAVAEESDGAFDPTVGLTMEARGYNEEYRTGAIVRTSMKPDADSGAAISYRDVHLDDDHKTIMLVRPLVVDLGAVAKGLAIDMAVRELAPFENFAIDAGGDLYLAGCNRSGEPWSVGIRHPRDHGGLVDTLRVTNVAVCTSGDYERRHVSHSGSAPEGGHHIVDPRTGAAAALAASVTVLAPSAMVADALATAAFVLGPERGIDLLERHGVDGLIVTPALERLSTRGMTQRMQTA